MTGSVSSFSDAAVMFTVGAISGGLAYGVSKGISTSFAASRLSNIMGTSSKNSVINANLKKAGYGYLKIGREGLEGVANSFYQDAGYETMQRTIKSVFDFGLGVVN